MNPRASVTIGGAVTSVTIKPADMVRFERKFSATVSDLADNPHLEWTLWMAWSACRREHPASTPEDFEVFVDSVDDLDVDWSGDPPLGQAA